MCLRRIRSTAARAAVLAAATGAGLVLLAPVQADEFPKRKPGLWEMKTTGGPVGPQTVQQCIDAATDDMLRTQSNAGEKCTKPIVERSGSNYKVRSSCSSEGVKSSIDGEYGMSRDTEYSGHVKMTFDPPMAGVSEMNMKMDGKWLGPCKDGMKPGDVVMQGMPRLNVLEIGKGGDGTGMTEDKARAMAEEMKKNMARQRPPKPTQ